MARRIRLDTSGYTAGDSESTVDIPTDAISIIVISDKSIALTTNRLIFGSGEISHTMPTYGGGPGGLVYWQGLSTQSGNFTSSVSDAWFESFPVLPNKITIRGLNASASVLEVWAMVD